MASRAEIRAARGSGTRNSSAMYTVEKRGPSAESSSSSGRCFNGFSCFLVSLSFLSVVSLILGAIGVGMSITNRNSLDAQTQIACPAVTVLSGFSDEIMYNLHASRNPLRMQVYVNDSRHIASGSRSTRFDLHSPTYLTTKGSVVKDVSVVYVNGTWFEIDQVVLSFDDGNMVGSLETNVASSNLTRTISLDSLATSSTLTASDTYDPLFTMLDSYTKTYTVKKADGLFCGVTSVTLRPMISTPMQKNMRMRKFTFAGTEST